ncbi:hypothetical protein BHF71_08835 [Vulcanibacillus modesticaldus]|uniref:Response regulatory domain-containing protein n=1 Tax=Vulcanibacillus modesticaldus TaxID=337097 RepID=A0A1D2YUX8_9BACI|nr:response regulator [Vulcanibacillus modesticaldus]OEF99514.1 hypothetical protein BHF71_08835 [Vulcanibacillus modesticaldus]
MSDLIRVLIVDDNEDMRGNIRKILSFESRIDVVGEAADGYQAIDMAAKYKPDIVLMDINMPGLDGISATERISLKCPYTSVIVISVQGENEYLKRAMLAGAKEYLIKPFSPEDINQTILNVYERNKERTTEVYAHKVLEQGYVQAPKVITVFSGKGGVGKSLIATNLAVGLAKLHKKVVIVDLDLMFGDVASLFNLKIKETIYHLVQEIERLDSESILSYLVETSSKVRVLAAPIRPEQSEMITGVHVEKIIRLLKETHDYVIVDTPSQLTDPVLTLEQSDFILLVNTLSVPVLRHNKNFLEILKSLSVPTERVRIIINRATLDTGVKIKDVKTALGMELYCLLPEERFVDLSINTGEPLLEMKASSRWSKEMNKLVQQIIAEDERAKSESWIKRFRLGRKRA